MHLLFDVLGIIGVIAINISYFLLSTGKLQADNWIYPFANCIGALLIVLSLLIEWNLSAFLMEGGWVLISFYGLMKSLKSRKSS